MKIQLQKRELVACVHSIEVHKILLCRNNINNVGKDALGGVKHDSYFAAHMSVIYVCFPLGYEIFQKSFC